MTNLEPPQSIPAEQAVLGSILKDPEVIDDVVTILHDPYSFYEPRHKEIYKSILSLFHSKKAVDYTTVAEALGADLASIGNRSYLIELVEGVASTSNALAYAEIIMEKYRRRQLISLSNNITADCYEEEKDIDEIIANLDKSVMDIREHGKVGFELLADLIPDTTARIDKISRGEITGIKTGFRDLDDKIGWLEPGDFVVIVGMQSSGKTSLAFNMAEHMAVEQGIPVAIFSIEGTKDKTATRFLCSIARVNSLHIKQRKLTSLDWENMARATGKIETIPIYIDDTSHLTISEIKAKMSIMVKRHGIRVFMFDYIQKIHSKGEDIRVKNTNIAYALKETGEELGVVTIALSASPRSEGGSAESLTPKESGDISYEADVQINLWRKNRGDTVANAFIDKCRNGETGNVQLAFIPQYTRFEDLDLKHELKEPAREIPEF